MYKLQTMPTTQQCTSMIIKIEWRDIICIHFIVYNALKYLQYMPKTIKVYFYVHYIELVLWLGDEFSENCVDVLCIMSNCKQISCLQIPKSHCHLTIASYKLNISTKKNPEKNDEVCCDDAGPGRRLHDDCTGLVSYFLFSLFSCS